MLGLKPGATTPGKKTLKICVFKNMCGRGRDYVCRRVRVCMHVYTMWRSENSFVGLSSLWTLTRVPGVDP